MASSFLTDIISFHMYLSHKTIYFFLILYNIFFSYKLLQLLRIALFSLSAIVYFFFLICLMLAHAVQFSSVQSVSQSCLTLCNPMNCSTPGLPVHHQLPESTQTHVHCVSDAIQPSHLLLSPSPPAPNLSQHQDLFQWVSSAHEVTKVLEFHLHHQSCQWTPRTDLL